MTAQITPFPPRTPSRRDVFADPPPRADVDGQSGGGVIVLLACAVMLTTGWVAGILTTVAVLG